MKIVNEHLMPHIDVARDLSSGFLVIEGEEGEEEEEGEQQQVDAPTMLENRKASHSSAQGESMDPMSALPSAAGMAASPLLSSMAAAGSGGYRSQTLKGELSHVDDVLA